MIQTQTTRSSQASRRCFALLASLLLLIMLMLWLAVSVGWLGALDEWGHAQALEHRTQRLTSVALFVTRGGDRTFVMLLGVVAAVLVATSGRPYRWLAGVVVFAGASATLVVRLGEADVVRRLRPPTADWAGAAGGFAFPSGHTTAATVGFLVLAWALCLHLSASSGLRAAIWLVAVWCGLGVGWSRVWLGVHWPTDVIGGWCIGGLGALLTCHVAGRLFGASSGSQGA